MRWEILSQTKKTNDKKWASISMLKRHKPHILKKIFSATVFVNKRDYGHETRLSFSQNVIVEWLTLLSRILQSPGSNIGYIGGLHGFSQSFGANDGAVDALQNKLRLLPPITLQFHNYHSSQHLMLYNLRRWNSVFKYPKNQLFLT
jgi:hypothetical protein